MAYQNLGDYPRLLKRTLLGLLDFSGRSTRAEVVVFMITAALAHRLIMSVTDGSAASFADIVFAVLIPALFAALFVRRLHDHGRSGWWALLLPVMAAYSIFEMRLPDGFQFAGLGMLLILFALLAAAGDRRANRFGSNPRASLGKMNVAV